MSIVRITNTLSFLKGVVLILLFFALMISLLRWPPTQYLNSGIEFNASKLPQFLFTSLNLRAFQLLGIASYALPIALFLLGYDHISNKTRKYRTQRAFFVLCFLWSSATFIQLLQTSPASTIPVGGMVGHYFSVRFSSAFGQDFSRFCTGLLAVIALINTLGLRAEELIEALFSVFHSLNLLGQRFIGVTHKFFKDMLNQIVFRRRMIHHEAKTHVENEFTETSHRFNCEFADNEDIERLFEYTLPPMDILAAGKLENLEWDKQTAAATEASEKVMSKLHELNLKFNLKGMTSGPFVSRLELAPEKGVRVADLLRHEQEIGFALGNPNIRIEIAIPGKDVVGLEIPNRDLPIIHFSHLLTEARKHRNRLNLNIKLMLGVDQFGCPFFDNLSSFPHLLIGGATGSGKSVLLNSLICYLIFNYLPYEVQFILIDPKRVEFSTYDHIPHLAIPIIREIRENEGAFNYLIRRMKRRYDYFENMRIKNIQQFYQLRDSDSPSLHESPCIPYIIVFVDELADLLLHGIGSIEKQITLLAQQGRAAGIHLVFATQRPSADIVRGSIKVNFPARIALKTASRTDSEVILGGTGGAEKLLGRGDMLFRPSTSTETIRLHGTFVSAEDIDSLVEWYHVDTSA